VACSSFLSSSTLPLSPPSSPTMTKPTLFQSILGRPSQSYSFPASKEYHSAKHDLLRAATQQTRSPDDLHLRSRSIVSAPDAESGYFSSSSTSSHQSKTRTSSDVASSDRRSRVQRDTEVRLSSSLLSSRLCTSMVFFLYRMYADLSVSL
jgi:hypothetical protein